MFALDAAGHPDPQQCKDSGALFVGQYVGTRYQNYGVSRGYIDQCLAIGLGVLLIFEEWASQFLGGYDDGREMLDRMHTGWDTLGAPNDGTVIPAVALVDPSPGAVPGHEAQLVEFAHAIDVEMWLPEWTGYGSKYGLDVVRNSGAAPKLTRRWGVGTWGFGETPSGALPANTDADMIQHGNLASPVTGTDYNTVFRADMGQWGALDMPITEAEWDRINLIVLGHARELAGAANVDGSLPTVAQLVGDVAALSKKVDALAGGQGGAVDYAAIAKAVNDDAAARLKD